MSPPKKVEDGAGPDDLAETRRRCTRINYYLDLIPSRFYLSNEEVAAQTKGKGKWSHLDPFQAMSTTEMLRVKSRGEDDEEDKKKKKKKRSCSPSSEPEPAGRGELVNKLHRRIEELKEERHARQSYLDKAKAAEIRATREKEGTERPERSEQPEKPERPASRNASRLEGKRRKLEEDGEPEAGRLSFEATAGQLPFEAGVGLRGQKVRKLQSDLRKQEAEALKLKEAESQGKGEDVRKELAYSKALQRARGEKVHDDVSKLRKVQKSMEMKKKKGQERWDAKKENDKRKVEEQQAQRKENLQNRGTKKKAKMQQRMGFEGEKTGFLNSGPY